MVWGYADMARRKRTPDAVDEKCALSTRLVAVRTELFGARGAPEMARHLGLPIRSWYNYESGATVPGEVVLKVITLTSVEPTWLLHGTGPKYREAAPEPDLLVEPGISPSTLIAAALELIESGADIRLPTDGRPKKWARIGRSPGRPRRK